MSVKKNNFFVRLCYGYVSKYKDTSKMTTQEVIEEFLKRKGVSSPQEFFLWKFAVSKQSGAINGGTSGADNGAFDDDADREEKEALKMYQVIKNDDTDIIKISKNTGVAAEKVKIAKEHLFLEKHHLTGGYRTFDPSKDIAESWKRLTSGKGIKEQDRILVLHEYLEATYMRQGMSYENAHKKANEKYNYQKYYK